jgi:hypothetical protein
VGAADHVTLLHETCARQWPQHLGKQPRQRASDASAVCCQLQVLEVRWVALKLAYVSYFRVK